LFAEFESYRPEDDLEDDRQGLHFAAFDNNILAGYVRLSLKCDEGKLSRIFVCEKYSGKGVGSAMIKALIKHCVNINIKKLVLYSRQNAAGFYRKLGFAETGVEITSPASGLKLSEMVLNLFEEF